MQALPCLTQWWRGAAIEADCRIKLAPLCSQESQCPAHAKAHHTDLHTHIESTVA